MSGASRVSRRAQVMQDGAMPSHLADSLIVVNDSDSSSFFHRKVRAGALIRVAP